MIYQALDYGISEEEECFVSHELETLFHFMTNSRYDNCEEGGATGSHSADNEGIEKDTMEEHHCTLGEVARVSVLLSFPLLWLLCSRMLTSYWSNEITCNTF